MSFKVRRLSVYVLLLVTAAVSAALVWAQARDRTEAPLVPGLDHIPLAVIDLDQAAARYRELGFTLKPGRPHENGIRNQHVKFSDGTAIELITAAEARDPLTTEYIRHLAKGDGPAFVGFYAPEMNDVARRLDTVGKSYRRDGGMLSFPEADGMRYIFFGQRNSSPTDRPEFYQHANGAEALIGVWIASDDFAAERDIFRRLGVKITEEEVRIPEVLRVPVVRLPRAEALLLPGVRQVVPGRRIVGATIKTRDLETLLRVLAEGSWNVPPTVKTKNGRSVFLPPSITHGIWLEFREQR